jgi:mono/diheme cytochrome c family protein
MHLYHASVPVQTIKKIVSLVVIAVAAALFGADLVPDVALASPQSASLERGRYLVEAVAICFECHSERDFSKAGWPIPPGRMGSGRIMWGEGSANAMVAPNITPDMQTGIGGWSDEEIVRAIQYGIGKDGGLLNPEMPSRYFRSLSDDELRSIVMYLRSIPAVKNSLPAMAKYVPGKHRPGIAMDSIRLGKSSAVVTRGAHLVRIAGCETCHTPTNENGFISGLEFAGGMIFRHGEQSAASSNLTPDTTGIGQYDEKWFVETMRNGKVEARELMSAMPWHFYRNMTDGDLKAIFAYLQALPPVKHQVNNTEPPTKCVKCGNLHGLGNRN